MPIASPRCLLVSPAWFAAGRITPIVYVSEVSNSTCWAQASAPAPSSPQHHVETVDDRVDELHAELKISPAEEEKWAKVVDAMCNNAKTVDDLVQQRHQLSSRIRLLVDFPCRDIRDFWPLAQMWKLVRRERRSETCGFNRRTALAKALGSPRQMQERGSLAKAGWAAERSSGRHVSWTFEGLQIARSALA